MYNFCVHSDALKRVPMECGEVGIENSCSRIVSIIIIAIIHSYACLHHIKLLKVAGCAQFWLENFDQPFTKLIHELQTSLEMFHRFRCSSLFICEVFNADAG